jgi:hypothetical protein
VVLVEAAVVVGGFICHEFFLPWLWSQVQVVSYASIIIYKNEIK